MKLSKLIVCGLFLAMPACAGPDAADDDVAAATAELSSSCGETDPNKTYDSSYSGASIAGGYASTNFVSGSRCTKGYFVQLNSWKKTPNDEVTGDTRVGRVVADTSGLTRSACEGGRWRLYIWGKSSPQATTFEFINSHSGDLTWNGSSCDSPSEMQEMRVMERDLNARWTGKKVKYAITASKSNGTQIPVRMGTSHFTCTGAPAFCP